jgi:transcriptional regulator with XRE-family HTH domain
MKLNPNKLDICMADACMSVDELAEKSGVSKNTLYSYRRGMKNPRGVTVGRIAKALGVKAVEIID